MNSCPCKIILPAELVVSSEFIFVCPEGKSRYGEVGRLVIGDTLGLWRVASKNSSI